MAKERQQSRFFQLRKDGRDALRKLTQEQKGLLLDIVFDYANAESEEERNDILEQVPDICVNIVAGFLCADIRESERLYNEKCERNREIALNRERMRAERREATQQKPAEQDEEAAAVPMDDEANEEADEVCEPQPNTPETPQDETPGTPEDETPEESETSEDEESKAPQTKPVKAKAVPIEEAEYIDEQSKEDSLQEESWRNEQWRYTLVQYFQINQIQLEKYWNDFKIFCASGEKYHKDVRDLKAHFRDWINKKENEYGKNSNKQREREAEERKRSAVALMCKFINEDSPSNATAMGEHNGIFNGL